jgi:hypothetical protein
MAAEHASPPSPGHPSRPPQYPVSSLVDVRAPIRSLLRRPPTGTRLIRLVAIGLAAFLVGGAGVAVAAIALAPLGAAIAAFGRTSRSVDYQRLGNA